MTDPIHLSDEELLARVRTLARRWADVQTKLVEEVARLESYRAQLEGPSTADAKAELAVIDDALERARATLDPRPDEERAQLERVLRDGPLVRHRGPGGRRGAGANAFSGRGPRNRPWLS